MISMNKHISEHIAELLSDPQASKERCFAYDVAVGSVYRSIHEAVVRDHARQMCTRVPHMNTEHG